MVGILIVDYGSEIFPIDQGTLPWQPIVALKLAKSAYSPLFVALAFGNGLQYRHSDFNSFICDDLATSCEHLMNFSPVNLEFKRVKCVHPRRSAVWLRSLYC